MIFQFDSRSLADSWRSYRDIQARCVRLDRKVDNYKGVRPISFYSWDMDCILDVLRMALDDVSEYPDQQDEGYIQLHQLYLTLKQAAEETYGR
jgi:hypothetical protein